MPYGNFYVGKDGFFYKKMTGGGNRRNFSIDAICNQPQNVFNKYVPGAGVGASNIMNRRAKLIRATSCNKNQQCGRFFTQLGLYPQLTPLHPYGTIADVTSTNTIQ
jgi:hypothetical protein